MQAFSNGDLGTRTWLAVDCRSVFVCVCRRWGMGEGCGVMFRELKRRTSTRSGLFTLLSGGFAENFQSNRLFQSKEAKEYKFYIIKAC